MKTKLDLIKNEALTNIDNALSQQTLNELKSTYLGKKSALNDIMKSLGQLDGEKKKELGQLTNEFKKNIENALETKKMALEDAMVEQKLTSQRIDVTLPGKEFLRGSLHPLTKIIREVEDIFLGMGYDIAEGPEVESDLHNFEMLNVPKGHPARDMQDTFFVTTNLLLRTHTSPVQARTMLSSNQQPIRILCPGKVYRRDDDDATHSHQFMQFEGLVIDKHITMADLKGTLSQFMKKMFGEKRQIRFRPSYFPFTEPSVEVDVSCFKCNGKGCSLCKHNGWIEVLGAGMVHPNVLKMAGYNPDDMRGFAFGIGIERAAMLRYGIDDIRHFYTNDVRFLKQFERGE